nr:MAG TPA: hypothetical protein [Bacteriophage sp.]
MRRQQSHFGQRCSRMIRSNLCQTLLTRIFRATKTGIRRLSGRSRKKSDSCVEMRVD